LSSYNRKTKPDSPPLVPEGKINVTDPDSRELRTQGQPNDLETGRRAVRGMLVEAAFVAVSTPGPDACVLPARQRPSRQGDRDRRGCTQAGGAVLASADRREGLRVRAPALTANKLRELELRAGAESGGSAAAASNTRAATTSGTTATASERSLPRQNSPTADWSQTGSARTLKRPLPCLDFHLFEDVLEVNPRLDGVWEECSVLFRRLAAIVSWELSRLLNSVGGRQAAR
jgi:hypothetical protein